jgi:hypothetical protein
VIAEADMVVCIPGTRLVGFALIENDGNGLTVKVLGTEVTGAHGAAPETITL